MSFLFINTHELSALMGLPYVQQSAYLLGIRPYMDSKTFIVGIKRRISYQSLVEALYIEPHQGIQSGSPSRQQLRRVIKGLERAGLVEIKSFDKHLVLKCLLANSNNSNQNKADTNPTQQGITSESSFNQLNKGLSGHASEKADIDKSQKADTPLKENNYIYLLSQFEKFWKLYPLKKSKQRAWEAFQAINPANDLLMQMQAALEQQIQLCQQQRSQGEWVAAWKFPVNWLTQRCWEDEIQNDVNQEKNNAAHETNFKKQPVTDSFWESCKAGIKEQPVDNIIELSAYRGAPKAY
ncbi:MAG: hypothetical protein WC627_03585 [Legionella sp.]